MKVTIQLNTGLLISPETEFEKDWIDCNFTQQNDNTKVWKKHSSSACDFIGLVIEKNNK